MSTVITQSLTLEEFLKLPKTKPASEYINGEIIQKPMPKGKHSRLQLTSGIIALLDRDDQHHAAAVEIVRKKIFSSHVVFYS